MKYLIYLILSTLNLFSAQLILNRYEETGQSVDLYHLIDKSPIVCTTEYGEGFEKIIRCRLQKPVKLDKKSRTDTYFDIYFHEDEIIFKAKRFAQILPIDDRLIDKTVVTRNRQYRHWVIVGARKQPEVLVDKGEIKFNFPVKYAQNKAPFIGALDLNGEPVKNKKGAIYLAKIKKLFNNKKYQDLLKLVKQYQSIHRDSFKSEIELYRIRAERELAKNRVGDYSKVLRDALEWIENNPSNQHIPEAYLFVVESYLGKGRLKQAEKYLHMLTGGFSDNKFTQQAQIAHADTIYKQKKRRKEALKIYKEVLYGTKDLDTASMAAFRIAEAYLDFKEPTKAEKIFAKVLKSNPKFIKEYYQKSYRLAKRFADTDHYNIALKIADQLHDIKEKNFLDTLLKSIGYWEEQRGNSQKAIAIYNDYLKKFPKGKNKAFVLKHLDSLMLMQSDQNMTKKLLFIDQVLAKYQEPDIQKRALEEKAKILLQLGEYAKILALSKELKRYKLDSYIQEAAQLRVIKTLKEKECEKAVKTLQEYNITLDAKYDDDIFNCFMETGLYKKAQAIAQRHIVTKDLHEKLKWLYFMTKLYKKQDKNKQAILSGNDVLKLARTLGETRYEDILYDIAESYYNLREYDDLMLKTVKEIEKRFPRDIRNVDLFMKVVRYAQKRKDIMLELNYAKKVIDLQKRFKISVYSPRVEILYIHGLQKIGKYKEAFTEVQKLINKKLTDIQKAEVLYLAGELSVQLQQKQKAIDYFTKCGEVVENSDWQKLCAENLQLLEE